MFATARAALPYLALIVPAAGFAQAGPSDPQVIATAQTAKISVGSRKLEGHVIATVRVGDMLVVPLHNGVKVIEVVTLPARRGPAPEAQGCYRVLDGSPPTPLAPAQSDI